MNKFSLNYIDKKFINLIILCLFQTFLNGQNIEGTQRNLLNTELKMNQIESQIKTLELSRDSVRNVIKVLKDSITLFEIQKYNVSGYPTKIKNFVGYIYEDRYMNKKLFDLTPEDEFLVFDVDVLPFYKVYFKGKFGVMSYYSFKTDGLLISKIDSDTKQKKIASENQNLKKLVDKYGESRGKKIYNHQYWIGMTRNMTMDSLGHPDNINKSEGSWGVEEQWVYRSKELYLYFTDGILKSYQISE